MENNLKNDYLHSFFTTMQEESDSIPMTSDDRKSELKKLEDSTGFPLLFTIETEELTAKSMTNKWFNKYISHTDNALHVQPCFNSFAKTLVKTVNSLPETSPGAINRMTFGGHLE